MIGKIEKRIITFKRKLDPKVLTLVFFCIFGFFVIYSLEMTNNFKRQKQLTQDEYNRSMYEMIGYIKNVDLNLTKMQIISDKSLMITTLADIWRQSNLAKENLSNLPIIQDNMGNTSKYLTQVSDYSFMLMKTVSRNEDITDEQYDIILKLNEGSTKLVQITNNIYEELNSGRLKWDEVEKLGNEQLDVDVAVSNIEEISLTFIEYEGLIYDGAYSDHIIQMTPKNLSENIVTEEEAKTNIQNIFGQEHIEYLNYTSESNNEKIELYVYEMKLKQSNSILNIYMTKRDGKMYLMVGDRFVEEQKITVDTAKDIGKEFLVKLGIENVVDTYYFIDHNFVTINYAATQNDIILYADLVKVKIALDNGEVYSIETGGYIYNHHVRDNVNANITIHAARDKLNKSFEVESENLAIIPTESKKELLVYEFKGSINERKCIIYINAMDGREENVIMVIETPNGNLTM